MKSRRSSLLSLLAGILVFALNLPAAAQQGGAAYYRYDANGRLTKVLSPSGEAVTYDYDPAGNFTSITRYAANQLSILEFTPGTGSAGTTVTIYGTGFSATPAANTVKFNGVTATVIAAANIRLDAQVPAGATSGPINITNANGTINSSQNFYIVSATTEFDSTIQFGADKTFTFAKTVSSAPLTNVGLLRFDGVSGQRVSCFFDQIIPYGVLLAASPYATISIISPSGASIASFQIILAPINGQTQDIFGYFDPVTLPASGTYTILIDPNDNLGTILHPEPYGFAGTARIYDVPPDSSGAIAASGLPTPVGFSAPGQKAVLTFNGLNGQRICLLGSQDAATQIGTDVKLYAPGAYPAGTPLVSQTLFSSFFVDTMTLTSNGSYTILADPLLNKTRAATLALYDVPPDVTGSLTIGASAQTMSIPAVGQAANLTFTVGGSGTQSVTIRLRNLAIGPFGAPSTLTLLQDGTQIYTQTINSNADYDIQRPLSPGGYVLKIDPQQNYTGSFNIYLTTP